MDSVASRADDAIQPPAATADVGVQAIEPELWNLTRAAVWGAGAAADRHLEAGGWRPRVALPSVGTFDSGWPNLSRSRLFPKDDAPTNFSALFGSRRDQLKPIAYSDIPELVALISYVRARDDLRARVAITTAAGREDLEDWMLEFEVADLALSLLDRARATGVADDALLSLYLERERAWLLDPLPVEYVVPLVLTAFELDQVFVIDATTRVEPMDAATHAARAPSENSITSVPDPVIGAATHALVLSGRQLSNPGLGPRVFGRDNEPVPFDEADVACEALRIATHIDVGYAQVLRRPLGWVDRWDHDLPPLTTVATVRRYPDWFDDYGWLRAPNPIPNDAVQLVPPLVSSLRTAAAHVRLAARRLSLAALRAADDDRTIDACIGLEALLGEGRDELSHRLALRAATALATRATDPADAQMVYELVRKVYSHRSAVVHGTPGDRSRRVTLGDRTYDSATMAVVLLREVLTDALTRPGGWTPKTLDATLLSKLAPIADPADGPGGGGRLDDTRG